MKRRKREASDAPRARSQDAGDSDAQPRPHRSVNPDSAIVPILAIAVLRACGAAAGQRASAAPNSPPVSLDVPRQSEASCERDGGTRLDASPRAAESPQHTEARR